MTLLDVCDFIVDCPHSTAKDEGTGYPLIRTPNIGKGRLLLNGVHRVSKEVYDLRNARAVPEPGDLILAREAPVGNVAVIQEGQEVCLGQRTVLIRPNQHKTDSRFLVYYLLSPKMQHILLSSSNGATVSHLNVADIKKLEIELPELSLQRKVGSFLSLIDDKIDTNNEINRNLLEQLDLLYESWFGKYKPFNLGIGGDPDYELEAGWHVEDIYAIAKIIYGAPFASKLFNTDGEGKPIVRIRDLKAQELCTFTTENHPKGYMLQAGDIVVGMDGEFRPYIWGNEEAWLNQRVCVFDNIRENGKAFIYCTIKPLLHTVEATEVATTVIHIGKRDFDEFRVVLPPENILAEFESLSRPMYDQIVQGQLENRRLENLRDSLLPKLMSGELDVSALSI